MVGIGHCSGRLENGRDRPWHRVLRTGLRTNSHAQKWTRAPRAKDYCKAPPQSPRAASCAHSFHSALPRDTLNAKNTNFHTMLPNERSRWSCCSRSETKGPKGRTFAALFWGLEVLAGGDTLGSLGETLGGEAFAGDLRGLGGEAALAAFGDTALAGAFFGETTAGGFTFSIDLRGALGGCTVFLVPLGGMIVRGLRGGVYCSSPCCGVPRKGVNPWTRPRLFTCC